MEIYFDAVTDVLWQNEPNFEINDAIKNLCENLKNNDTSKEILSRNKVVKGQLCLRNYKALLGELINLENDRTVLVTFVQSLQKDAILENINMVEFFNDRKDLVKLMKVSMQYSEDMGLGVYIKYLQSNLQHYDVVLSFLAGDDWWETVRSLYNGTYATEFFDSVENSFVIGEDILTNLDKIRLVRLLYDMKLNSTDDFCMDNITLSDYIPDTTGALSRTKRELCGMQSSNLFREIPPLLFASQGYDGSLQLSKDVDYPSIELDIARVQEKLQSIGDGPKAPRRPSWITDEKIDNFKRVVKGVFSREASLKIVFGTMYNLIDGFTLFFNNSDTVITSAVTTWIRQINLQLFKKDEYDNLLCDMRKMTQEEVYAALKNDFHWDMAVQELLSSRNYTSKELNKSLQELLQHVFAILQHDMANGQHRLRDCELRGIESVLGNVSYHFTLLNNTLRMLHSAVPHLGEIDGVRSNRHFVELQKAIAHRLSVWQPLKTVLPDGNILDGDLVGMDLIVDDFVIDMKKVLNHTTLPLYEWLGMRSGELRNLCTSSDCDKLGILIIKHLNLSTISRKLPQLQDTEFWTFNWVSTIFHHTEIVVNHFVNILNVASHVDVNGVVEGRITALIDAMLTVMQQNNIDVIVHSLNGILEEVHLLVRDTDLERELQALSNGLRGLIQFRSSIVEGNDLSVEVWRVISHPERLESEMRSIGINHTNFWSVAASRIHAGRIDFKPLFTAPNSSVRIRAYVCQSELTSTVLLPSLDTVTADDVNRAVAEQFCDLTDDQIRQLIPAVLRSLNVTYVINSIIDTVLLEVYHTSNLAREQGARVLAKYKDMVELMPSIRENLSDVGDTLSKEPLLKAFRKADSLRGLLSSSEFLSGAGEMLCGRALVTDNNRFYKAIAETKDFSSQPDPRQLQALPTDFCRSLYKDVLSMGGGKILWSFVKPLIMGRILYTPTTPAVEEIVTKANESFAQMARMRQLIFHFAEAFDSIESLSQHKSSLTTLRHMMNSDRFRTLLDSFSSMPSDGPTTNVDFEKIFEDLGDVKSMGAVVKRMADILRCVNMNRFRAMPDEPTLTNEAVKLTIVNEFSAGIVFNSDPRIPGNVDYKIRMDIESVPTTSRKRNQFWTPGPEANFIENMRYFRGFIQVQDLIDTAVVRLARNKTASGRHKRDTESAEVNWAVYTQQMPYPCYKRDVFQASLYESQALIVAFFFAFILTVSSAVRFTIHERESGNTTLMSVMGLRLSNHTLSWFIASLVETVLASTLALIVLKLGGILPRSSPVLLWLLLLNFAVAVVTFCYMTSKLFRSASLGSVCTCILYLMMFLPYVIVLSMEAVLTTALKVATCLSMCTAFSYSTLYIARYEAVGVGAQWSNVWHSPDIEDDMSLASVTLVLLGDSLLYTLIGWSIEWYTEYRNRSDNLVNCTSSDEKSGISIINVCKTYALGSRREKIALDNVSIELNRGQVTTLLGQNGAGKTTLIKIITGMLRPTSGSIVLRSSDDHQTVRLGVCPQHDVLIENMTAVEHLQFYATLKSGRSDDTTEKEVHAMLQVLSFGSLAYEQVNRLSGGLRRRLCVALAFICRPKLVLLDEPSSGVDPVARRDTWSLIEKLKEDRTVLMTTHHLDEAELLSDQIVIMHKGRVHTAGSPIEIKRGLGSGYKLTAFYTQPVLDADADEPKASGVEELSKELLGSVRSVVKNASLGDVKGREVEVTLPFFDGNGLNNDFLALCQLLEKKQHELGFTSFAMDCSSLEQVFLAICRQADGNKPANSIESDLNDCEASSSSSSHDYQTASTNSVKGDDAILVPDNGRLRGTHVQQYVALLHKRYMHYTRNLWLLTLLFIVPTVFVFVAMGFSLIRPPADNEVSLKLDPTLYGDSTEFLVPKPENGTETRFAENVMAELARDKLTSVWSEGDNPQCKCEDVRQHCDFDGYNKTLPEMLLLPNVREALDWATSTQELYVEKRYGGWSSSLANNGTNLVAWYNNKGHHAMPAYVNALSTALLRSVTGHGNATITTHTHPLKISEERLSKSTVLQHVADIGIAAVILVGFSLIPAGGAIYLVSERDSKQKRLQLLCGVHPVVYWFATITWDMLIVVINIVLTVCVMEIFQLPVFVEKDNLPAICLLLLLYGWACGNCIHVFEKCFTDASLANMLMFCLNVFVGVSCLAVLLILDIISDSQLTDNARWVLHKIFMLSPQFALGDGLIEVAKNSIQAQVLKRFGMDTYSSPLFSGLIVYHYAALVLVGVLMFVVNMAIELGWIGDIVARWRRPATAEVDDESEDLEVATERYRVELSAMRAQSVARPMGVHTIGNINAGFVNTEGNGLKVGAMTPTADAGDVLQCLSLRKEYSAVAARRVAVHNLTFGMAPGECMALLGENGAGKSTTFNMLSGALRPSSGDILLRERRVTNSDLTKGLISYCPQNDALDPLLTVREQLRFYCCLRGISSYHEVITKTMNLFDLKRYSEQYTSKLSGGNKRKLCLAIAMMGRTPLVLLDEPTSGMDPGARRVVARGINSACATGRAVLLSTHALEDARRLATRLAILRRGKLKAVGPLTRLLERFGSGHMVCVRASRGADVSSVWQAIRRRFPQATLQSAHYTTLQVLLQNQPGEPHLSLSHVFSELANLQSRYDIEDFTLNQNSLYQMFDSFSDKKPETAPSLNRDLKSHRRTHSDELVTVTSL